jgi:hypothetical protein
MKLVPVIEFAPYNFQSADRQSPGGDDVPQDWADYWRNSLADAGILDIEPYQFGSWLVEASKLTPEVLVKLLQKEEYAIDNRTKIDLEEIGVGALSGGYVLEVSATVHVMPQCCGDIGNIKDWEIASEWTNPEETILWIGHPWLEVRSIDERYIEIRRTSESDKSDEPEIITIDRNELKAAIIDTKKQLYKFKQMLLIALPNVFPHLLADSPSPTANEITELLIYG